MIRMGGSLSGEHGDGQSRAELLPRMFGPELVEAFREFKAIWDPLGRMNPGKVVDAFRVDDNLRLGTDFRPPAAATHFQYPDDDGDFTRATLRCVGVGECRREHGGTMCPSYRATREEMHSTRGRAHLLFEMMRGQELDGWKDQHIHESLDLCLACKGCKGDCPINVDVATYKAEFLAHHYEGRLRPVAAYSMGLVHWWARLAAHDAGARQHHLAVASHGATLQAPGWRCAPASDSDVRHAEPSNSSGGAREPRNPHGQPVVLWPDTFNDHFFPETALAAAEVLEALGFRVVVPEEDVCCGRPLYDFGMLTTAKRLLQKDLRVLRGEIAAGTPVVGLEPSCVSVFRDEMTNLLPHDRDAQRLRSQTFLFAEFLTKHAHPDRLAKLSRKAVVHGHCHHKALFGLDDEKQLLQTLGLDVEVLDTGCCGMAGSFGFERGEKYRVSQQIGELDVLPKVRAADPDALLVSDGFSCREQIRGGTPRRAMHVAEVARMAVAGASRLPARSVARLDPARPLGIAALALAGLGIAALQAQPAGRDGPGAGRWLRLCPGRGRRRGAGRGRARRLRTKGIKGGVMSRPIGRFVWVIPEGYIPSESHGPQPAMTSHETACLLNAGDTPCARADHHLLRRPRTDPSLRGGGAAAADPSPAVQRPRAIRRPSRATRTTRA